MKLYFQIIQSGHVFESFFMKVFFLVYLTDQLRILNQLSDNFTLKMFSGEQDRRLQRSTIPGFQCYDCSKTIDINSGVAIKACQHRKFFCDTCYQKAGGKSQCDQCKGFSRVDTESKSKKQQSVQGSQKQLKKQEKQQKLEFTLVKKRSSSGVVEEFKKISHQIMRTRRKQKYFKDAHESFKFLEELIANFSKLKSDISITTQFQQLNEYLGKLLQSQIQRTIAYLNSQHCRIVLDIVFLKKAQQIYRELSEYKIVYVNSTHFSGVDKKIKKLKKKIDEKISGPFELIRQYIIGIGQINDSKEDTIAGKLDLYVVFMNIIKEQYYEIVASQYGKLREFQKSFKKLLQENYLDHQHLESQIKLELNPQKTQEEIKIIFKLMKRIKLIQKKYKHLSKIIGEIFGFTLGYVIDREVQKYEKIYDKGVKELNNYKIEQKTSEILEFEQFINKIKIFDQIAQNQNFHNLSYETRKVKQQIINENYSNIKQNVDYHQIKINYVNQIYQKTSDNKNLINHQIQNKLKEKIRRSFLKQSQRNLQLRQNQFQSSGKFSNQIFSDNKKLHSIQEIFKKEDFEELNQTINQYQKFLIQNGEENMRTQFHQISQRLNKNEIVRIEKEIEVMKTGQRYMIEKDNYAYQRSKERIMRQHFIKQQKIASYDTLTSFLQHETRNQQQSIRKLSKLFTDADNPPRMDFVFLSSIYDKVGYQNQGNIRKNLQYLVDFHIKEGLGKKWEVYNFYDQEERVLTKDIQKLPPTLKNSLEVNITEKRNFFVIKANQELSRRTISLERNHQNVIKLYDYIPQIEMEKNSYLKDYKQLLQNTISKILKESQGKVGKNYEIKHITNFLVKYIYQPNVKRNKSQYVVNHLAEVEEHIHQNYFGQQFINQFDHFIFHDKDNQNNHHSFYQQNLNKIVFCLIDLKKNRQFTLCEDQYKQSYENLEILLEKINNESLDYSKIEFQNIIENLDCQIAQERTTFKAKCERFQGLRRFFSVQNQQKQNEEKRQLAPSYYQLYRVEVIKTKNLISRIFFYNENIKNYTDSQIEEMLIRYNKWLRKLKRLAPLHNILFKENKYEKHIEQEVKYEQTLHKLKDNWKQTLESSNSELQQAFEIKLSHRQPHAYNKMNKLRSIRQIGFRYGFPFVILQKQVNNFEDIIDKNVRKIRQELSYNSKIIKVYDDENNILVKDRQKQEEKFTLYERKMIEQKQHKIQQKMEEIQVNYPTPQEKKRKQQNQRINIENQYKQIISDKRNKDFLDLDQKMLNLTQKKAFYINRSLNYLLILQKVVTNLQFDTEKIKLPINQFFSQFENLPVAEQIYQQLKKQKQLEVQNQMLRQHPIFNFQRMQEFDQITRQQDIDYVLNTSSTIKDNISIKRVIKEHYNQFRKNYEIVQRIYEKNPNEVTKSDIRENIKRNSIDRPSIQLLAGIFAYWSIIRSSKKRGQVRYVVNPHPAQIASIILLLIVYKKGGKFSNQFIEVKTGQGKSIVLAGVCIFLALKGFKPYCACYSQYLSQRDSQQFEILFKQLGVVDKIVYGTFNQHCQNIINMSKEHSFRKMLKDFFLSKGQFSTHYETFFDFIKNKLSEQKIDKRVLVIDEVDVFFDSKFYGEPYRPSIAIDGENIRTLIQKVWEQHKIKGKDLKSKGIIDSNEFKRVKEEFPHLEQMLRQQIPGMIHAVKNFEHPYYIMNRQIKYIQFDSIDDRISYGYQTIFAYCKQKQKGTVTNESYENALKINLICAQFSYAQLPNFFESILGVSGTIEAIPKFKKDLLVQKYKVNHFNLIPSIYGVSRKFVQEYYVYKDEQYHQKLIQHMDVVNHTKRPIIVFFKSDSIIDQLFNIHQFSKHKTNTFILSEKHDPSTRDAFIANACRSGRISLMTKSFGRGTDFKIYEEEIKKKGVHVIQTFLPQDEADHVQVKGRSGRQGKDGSYELIVSETQLEVLQIPKTDIMNIEKLRLAWARNNEKMQKIIKQNVKISLQKHQLMVQFFKGKIRQDRMIELITRLNPTAKVNYDGGNVKLVLGIDGTGSMHEVIRLLLQKIEESFDRINKILEDNKKDASFEYQIMIYRNYNCDQHNILSCSPFESNAVHLTNFIRNIKCQGGLGNEALEVMFQKINSYPLGDVHQILIIGDAAANTAHEALHKRKAYRGQAFWSEHYPLTDSLAEIQTIRENKIPIHSLYLPTGTNKGVADYFKKISKLTGGNSQEFNIRRADASETLAAFISERCLMQIGGQEFVKAYRNQYSKRYV